MRVQTSLPSKEECYIKGRAVQIDKLKKKHFQSEAVLPLRFSTRLLCKERVQSFRGLIRLTVSLDTKAADTFQSWQRISVLALDFKIQADIQKEHTASGLVKTTEISSNVWICIFPGG